MFDVSFTELLTIGVVALIVIGPERLPKVARTVGHLLGRAQRYVSDVKSDIRREMELEELRNLRKEMEDAARSLETTVRTNVDDLNKGFNEVQQTVEEAAREVKAAASESLPEPSADAAADTAAIGTDAGHGQPAPEPQAPRPAPTAAGPAAAATAAATPAAEPGAAAGEPAPAQDALPDHDPAQGSLFPADLLPPAVNQPAAGQPAEASTVRERT